MLRQRLSEGFYEASHPSSIVVFGPTCLGVLVECFETGCECAMLLDVLFHEARDTCDAFYVGKECLFLCIVVVVHRFGPALAVGEEVALCGKVGAWYVWRLDVDGVQPSYDAVVGEGHLCCDVVRGVRGLVVVSDGEVLGGEETHVFGEWLCGDEMVWLVSPLRRHPGYV